MSQSTLNILFSHLEVLHDNIQMLKKLVDNKTFRDVLYDEINILTDAEIQLQQLMTTNQEDITESDEYQQYEELIDKTRDKITIIQEFIYRMDLLQKQIEQAMRYVKEYQVASEPKL